MFSTNAKESNSWQLNHSRVRDFFAMKSSLYIVVVMYIYMFVIILL